MTTDETDLRPQTINSLTGKIQNGVHLVSGKLDSDPESHPDYPPAPEDFTTTEESDSNVPRTDEEHAQMSDRSVSQHNKTQKSDVSLRQGTKRRPTDSTFEQNETTAGIGEENAAEGRYPKRRRAAAPMSQEPDHSPVNRGSRGERLRDRDRNRTESRIVRRSYKREEKSFRIDAKEETLSRSGRRVKKPVTYCVSDSYMSEDHMEIVNADRTPQYGLRRSDRNRASVTGRAHEGQNVLHSPQTPASAGQKRRTRNSLGTSFAEDAAQQDSLTDAVPLIADDEGRSIDNDGDDEDDGDPIIAYSRVTRIRRKVDVPSADIDESRHSTPPVSSKRKRNLEDEEDEIDPNAGPYSLRKRNSGVSYVLKWPTDGGKKKSPEVDLDASLLNQSRPLRNRRNVDYNEGRAFRLLYETELGGQGTGAEDGRRWSSPPTVRPKRLPMASTVGGNVLSYDSEDEDDMGKPLFQYARCTALLEKWPAGKQDEIKERLRMHLDNNDFPTINATIQNKVTFDMIGGHEDHVKTIQEMIKIALLYPELNKEVEAIKGVLFYGPPGNGKTLMARAIASSCSTFQQSVAFFECHAADIHSKWFGDSEKHLKRLFDQAKANQPAIIFFDEIDGVVPARASGENATPHNTVVTALLTLMDGLENRGRVIVIGATNRLDTLDPALLRPGRFDRKLQFKRPNLDARKKIIDIKTKSLGLENSLIQELAAATEGYSGADLKSVCSDAYFKALRRTYPQIYDSSHKLLIDVNAIRVTRRDFLQALREIKPSAGPSDATSCPPSSHIQTLLSSTWERVLSRLELIHKIFIRRSSGASASVLQPRILVAGPPRLGQVQLAAASVSRLVEWGFRVELLRLGSNIESIDAEIHHVLDGLRLEPLPAIHIPSFEKWSPEAIEALDARLEAAPHPILILATWEQGGTVPRVARRFILGQRKDINQMMGYRSMFQLTEPSQAKRREFFSPILALINKQADPAEAALPPTALMDLPIAPHPPAPELTTAQRKAIDAKCWSVLQDLKQRLRTFHKEIGKTKFRTFCNPVDIEKYPDYLEVISEPMDLGLMMGKLDQDKYETPEDWLADIELICRNAKEYNEARSDIVHKACELRDDAHSFVQAIPSKYRLNYLQSMLWRRAEMTKQSVSTEDEETPESPSEHPIPPLPIETAEMETDILQDRTSVNSPDLESRPPTEGHTVHIGDISDLGAVPFDSKLVPSAELAQLEEHLLDVTEGMDVRNLEMLYQVLETEIQGLVEEPDRRVVLAAVNERLEAILEWQNQHDQSEDDDNDEAD
ncbi:uncharacterized protein SPPG_01683 [Spizellomyces punctatus DAOM BR117]|uniref:Bromo domain-containing protein n=1 Tax=Spizellomyces punctatus (strain DAOM BR117) TaxID=645134 RepID=A0A0L0HT19_SPIPD|nr:uncharacterized protein SPPG_01683 [Spizellomyces punctatus DAOM BR117]KND04253.1 hypothetical protein SPPG_01683 [Spizellomyces punctatus DAOM BR117]|eukprot:XP_016612292.1 hypothetical protein SPPG_01683 [Spizellomyces punctatus DAOM BR117]